MAVLGVVEVGVSQGNEPVRPDGQVAVVREEVHHGVVPELLSQGPEGVVHDGHEARLHDAALCSAGPTEGNGLGYAAQPSVQHLEAALQRRLCGLDAAKVRCQASDLAEQDVVADHKHWRPPPHAPDHGGKERECIAHGQHHVDNLVGKSVKEHAQLCEALDGVLDGRHLRSWRVHDLQEGGVQHSTLLQLAAHARPEVC
mmetsp:Transcript_80443/g.222532  ORF Transcript_80443/g.222532 Transcript_80443/m.222532 type:complete len:200 (-) Transcript_80443:71-670(-)